MLDYRTIFEARLSDLPWVFMLIGPAILVLAYVVARYSPKQHAKAVAGLALIVGTFWTVLAGTFFFQAASAMHDFSSGKSQVIEGQISAFSPMPPTGHATESFTVNGQRFAYSHLEFHGPCFDKTVVAGGPMRLGLHVRVNHVGNCILKLEVAR